MAAPAIFLLVDGTGAAKPRAAGTHEVPIRANYATDGSLGAGTVQVRALLLDSGLAVLGTGAWMSVTAAFAEYLNTITIAATATHVQFEAQII